MNYVFQFTPVFDAWPLLLTGTWHTIALSLSASTAALVAMFINLGAYASEII